MRVLLAFALSLGLLALAVVAFPVLLFGRPEARLQTARGMSRALSGLWDGQGDVTFSGWSYRMLLRGKPWGARRVAFVDWLSRSPGHCQRSWEWHDAHGLFDENDFD